ncbi:winged helix-turn-helix transcriptional regulator [Desulfobulbus sp. AH-315-M07]|nr:winged helix-turn-helix transcriptional regulator [Desulfobulbus sp. AH-315-M07]
MPVKCAPPEDDREVIADWAKAMEFTPDIDDRASLLTIIANRTRLRLFFVLDRVAEVCVCDLAEILGVSQSAVSQHLAKFRAYRLVTTRRDNQTLFYSLVSTPEVKMLRKIGLQGIETPPRG